WQDRSDSQRAGPRLHRGAPDEAARHLPLRRLRVRVPHGDVHERRQSGGLWCADREQLGLRQGIPADRYAERWIWRGLARLRVHRRYARIVGRDDRLLVQLLPWRVWSLRLGHRVSLRAQEHVGWRRRRYAAGDRSDGLYIVPLLHPLIAAPRLVEQHTTLLDWSVRLRGATPTTPPGPP